MKRLIFILSAILLVGGFESASAQDRGRAESKAEWAKMQRYVKERVNPKAIKESFKSPSGDDVDCVDINEQPALRRPGMEGHKVQMMPKTVELKLGDDAKPKGKDNLGEGSQAEQSVAKGRRGCPKGTVPIQRLTEEKMKNFRSLDDFHKKVPDHVGESRGRGRDKGDEEVAPKRDIEEPRTGASGKHQYAHAYRSVDNWGAESVLNLWRPYTERTSEFSLSQIWVTRGGGADLETVEVGWQKYKDLYGDYNPRLFIYFTPDNYGRSSSKPTKGCYNLTCDAFVQVNNSVYIGGAFANYSTTGGTQHWIKVFWYKDGTTGDWWLKYGGTWVGYYPRSLFDAKGLKDKGAVVDFGGEIIDFQGDSRHTQTDMGSGAFPYLGWGKAAFHRSIRYVDTNNYWRKASGLTPKVSDRWCYDIDVKDSSGSWGSYFYFGGSGYNTYCK